MNVMLRPGWTLEQFLAWEERQPTRYEFDGKNVIDMNGSTVRHQMICGNLHAILHGHFRAHPGQVLLPTQIRTGSAVRYPDVAVALASQALDHRHVIDPVILFEVTSPSTELTDMTFKVDEYTSLSSLARYVVLAQSAMLILVFTRAGERWELTKLRDGSLDLPEIGLALSLDDIYAGVTFETEPQLR